MFMALFENALLGNVPETIGLFLFGFSLIALTIGLRWFLDMGERRDDLDENLEKLAEARSQK